MSSLAARRIARRPALESKLQHMSQKLEWLVNVDNLLPHPSFPGNILQFWLLTDDQLEAMASYYHQRTPSEYTGCYPCPVSWPRNGLTLEDKRRKFGRFIGLRGCQTPQRSTHSCRGHPKRSTKQTCRGECKMSWGDERICMPCSLRKIDEIFAEGDTLSSAPTVVETDTDMDVDMDGDTVMDDYDDSYYNAAEEKPLTVEDVVENAQRARLAATAGDEMMRRKTGHY
ncbi:hypothetical protein Sste5346_008235 [Sporothrix stenoceras]|uniref:Uncharacterized protein n=1 Tax=Sporothrix stenoceras TaxID=5173 RepID=A0ABR3YPV7_9PEZI